MRRTLLVVALAAALLVAGCSGSETATQTTEGTTQPEPSVTETPTDSPSNDSSPNVDLVENPQEFSWLTDGGVNETGLFITHARTVNNESSYTTRATNRREALDGDGETVTRYRLQASADQGRAKIVVNRSVRTDSQTSVDNTTEYRELVDGSDTVYIRTAVDGNVEYGTESEPARNFSTLYRQSTGFDLTFLAMQFEFTYDRQTERNGRTLYRLTSDSVTADSDLDDSVSNFSAMVLVDRRGVVRSLEYSFDSTTDDTPFRTTYTFETTGLGSTTVERPGWLEQARQ